MKQVEILLDSINKCNVFTGQVIHHGFYFVFGYCHGKMAFCSRRYADDSL